MIFRLNCSSLLRACCFAAIPKVEIVPPHPGPPPPNHNNRIPDVDERRTTTTVRLPVTQRRIFPYVPRSTVRAPTTTTTTTTTTTITKAPLPPRRVIPPTRKPHIPTKRPVIPTRKPPVVTRKPYVPPPPPPPVTPVTPVDNSIQKEVTKQRGDVHSKFVLTLHVLLGVVDFLFFNLLKQADGFHSNFWRLSCPACQHPIKNVFCQPWKLHLIL